MLALILWLVFGPRIAVVEIIGELAVGAVLHGGGGGRRTLRRLRELLSPPVRLVGSTAR